MKISKAGRFWPLVVVLFVTDCSTKELVIESLADEHAPLEVVGDFVRLTLTYNTGAAMGLSFGPLPRPILVLVSLVAVAMLLHFYRRTNGNEHVRLIALGMLAGRALGNLVDRVRSPLGVVDFIDVGIGHYRFWTFNLADAGITLEVIVLSISMLRRGTVGREPSIPQ